MIRRRLFVLFALCVLLFNCKSKEKPAEQIDTPVEKLVIEPEPEEVSQLTEDTSGNFSTQSTHTENTRSSHQTVRVPSGLSSIGGRVNTREIDPAYFENPDLDILRQMGADQYLISFYSGEQFYNTGNYDRAITEYTVSINNNNQFIEAIISRGNSHLKKKDYQRAIDDYSRAIRLNSNRAELYNYRGFARAERGERNLAIEDFTRAIALNANYVDALINRSHAYYQSGDYDRAIEDCNRIIRLEPGNAYIWNRRGSAWYHKENDDNAIRDFTEAIRLRSDYAIAWHNRANAWQNKGDHARAASDLAQAQKLDTR
jgi:tetratricopeptide (TPR) repeat protein